MSDRQALMEYRLNEAAETLEDARRFFRMAEDFLSAIREYVER